MLNDAQSSAESPVVFSIQCTAQVIYWHTNGLPLPLLTAQATPRLRTITARLVKSAVY